MTRIGAGPAGTNYALPLDIDKNNDLVVPEAEQILDVFNRKFNKFNQRFTVISADELNRVVEWAISQSTAPNGQIAILNRAMLDHQAKVENPPDLFNQKNAAQQLTNLTSVLRSLGIVVNETLRAIGPVGALVVSALKLWRDYHLSREGARLQEAYQKAIVEVVDSALKKSKFKSIEAFLQSLETRTTVSTVPEAVSPMWALRPPESRTMHSGLPKSSAA